MGCDTIEINLVCVKIAGVEQSQKYVLDFKFVD